jgi:hypothetical protein
VLRPSRRGWALIFLSVWLIGSALAQTPPLADILPAHYTLKVSILSDGKEIVSGADEFDVTFQSAVARPWFYSKLAPGAADPRYDRIIGLQLFNAGRAEEARGRLEGAVRRDPASPESARALAAWEKSLQLSPDQPEIRKKVDALRDIK